MTPANAAPDGERRIRVDDIEIHCQTAGDGPPLLLIHGLGASARDWGPQIGFFRASYRVIAFDLRGHGRTSRPRDGYSIERFAQDTAGLLRALETGPVHVVGISLGGMIAFQLAVDAPDLVRSLTIVNSGPAVPAGTFKQRLPLYIRLVYIRLLGLRRMAVAIAKRLFPAPDHEALRQSFVDSVASNDKRCYLASLRAIFAGWSVADRLGQITCPVLAVAADQDYTPVALKQAYVDRLPNARLDVIPDSRHAVPMEKPGEFNALLSQFLSSPAADLDTRGATPEAH